MYATRQNGNGRQPDPSTKPKRAVKSPSNPLSLIRPKVEELSRSQQELSADRADLVDEREAFTSQGKDIRHQRIRTVAAEVQLMDAFRRAFNDASFPMPQDVVAAFQHVQEERDKLGPMEQEYLEADENLGASEWSLLEKEDRLYQFDLRDLLQSTTVYSDASDHDEPSPRPSREEITPSPAIQYQAAVAHLHQVVVRFENLRQQTVELANQRRPPDTDILDVIQDVVTNSHESADPSGELLMEIAVAQVRVQQLRQDILRESGQLHLRTRRNSEPAFLTGQQFSIDTISRAQTEGSIPDVLDNPPADERVQEWLENVLESNWDTNKRKQYLTCVNKEMELQGLSESNLNPWDDRLPQVLSGEKSFALTPGNSESLGWPGSPSRIHSDCFSFVDASIWTDVEPLQPKEMDDNRTISNHSSKTISGAENPPRISIVDHLGTSSPEPQEQTPCVPVQYPTDQPFGTSTEYSAQPHPVVSKWNGMLMKPVENRLETSVSSYESDAQPSSSPCPPPSLSEDSLSEELLPEDKEEPKQPHLEPTKDMKPEPGPPRNTHQDIKPRTNISIPINREEKSRSGSWSLDTAPQSRRALNRPKSCTLLQRFVAGSDPCHDSNALSVPSSRPHKRAKSTSDLEYDLLGRPNFVKLLQIF